MLLVASNRPWGLLGDSVHGSGQEGMANRPSLCHQVEVHPQGPCLQVDASRLQANKNNKVQIYYSTVQTKRPESWWSLPAAPKLIKGALSV